MPESSERCPLCGAQHETVLWQAIGVPAQSCRLHPSADAARLAPISDLDLRWCSVCAHGWNAAFDPNSQDTDGLYEESQAFSPVYSGFEDRSARAIAEMIDLRGGRALEIGCGKGTFIARLCGHASCEAVAYDPAYDPRRAPDGHERVNFRRERYTSEHAEIDAGLVVCRMTLEHAADPVGFLRLVGSSSEHASPLFVVQVPDAERIWRESAFWDVYHEHAQYFSARSLRAAMEQAGLAATSIKSVFGGQYLLACARRATSETTENPCETDRTGLRGARLDADRAGRLAEGWAERVRAEASAGGHVVLWASGSKAVAFLSATVVADHVRVVVDINPHRHGRFLPGSGLRVDAPDALVENRPTLVVLMNPAYRDEVRAHLAGMGLAPVLLALGDDPLQQGEKA